MMFVVTRSSCDVYERNEMPCENCIQVGEYVGYLDNHYPLWGIELETANDIVRFSDQVQSEIIITTPPKFIRDRVVLNEPYCNQKKLYEIEIYDDYRE